MKFGVRQIANVVFRASSPRKIGNKTFHTGQPVFYLDTAKTSTVEGAATTVYATGGRGNTRLLAWEGERTLTFTVEDALLSPISFSMLSGAGVVKGESSDNKKVHFHQTTMATVDVDSGSGVGTIDLKSAMAGDDTICPTAPIYVMDVDDSGDIIGTIQSSFAVGTSADTTKGLEANRYLTKAANATQGVVMVDYYVLKDSHQVTELQIDAENFGGYFYVEADTLFRNQLDGKDYPANLTFPNVKIQSNFTFSMAATGDPSTFTFTMDAFPGKTYFDDTKEVLCAIQIADENADTAVEAKTVFPHPADTKDRMVLASYYDSVASAATDGENDDTDPEG